MSQKDFIYVQLKDLVLAEFALQFEREQRLLDLSGVGLFPGQKIVPRDLHGDRACPLTGLPGLQVSDKRPQDTERINAVMAEKSIVLGSQDGVDQVPGSVFDLDGNSSFVSEFAHEPAVDAVYPKRFLQPDVLYDTRRGEICPDNGSHHEEGNGGRDSSKCR